MILDTEYPSQKKTNPAWSEFIEAMKELYCVSALKNQGDLLL
jgi:hypothetical protein